MRILTFNCGSSSLKYRMIRFPDEMELAGGEAQRIGPRTSERPRIICRAGEHSGVHFATMPDHATAFGRVLKVLKDQGCPPPDALAHRVVHGGSKFRTHVRVNVEVLEALGDTAKLAPLHNPPQLGLVRVCAERFPDLPQVLAFDTGYHSTIPERAHTYALPESLRSELGLRKYGFHGISHQYVASEAARFLGVKMEDFNAVSCHLGSGGASLCAIVGGRSVDTTMGYSPLQGLIMSTRCGDLDPAVALRLLAEGGSDVDSTENLLNRESGVLGMSGLSADLRDLLVSCREDQTIAPRVALTLQAYTWRIRKYLGAYLTVVGSPRAVIFTDTLGETCPEVRAAVCADMEDFGLVLDEPLNASAEHFPADIASAGSRVRALVVETNEELAIARLADSLLRKTVPARNGEER